MIKAAVFDLGKVLVDFDYSIAARRLAAQAQVSPAKLGAFIATSPLFPQLERGQLTTERFYDAICAVTGFRGSLAEFSAFFADIFFEIEPMVQLQATLRQQGIPCYVFSNTNDLAIRHIRRNFPFYGNFDGYVLSYEHGLMKPEAGLYEIVERMSGRRDAEILYLDDRPENIEAGAARGWQVILHESPVKSRTAIERFGLLNGR
jgi:HAD superfamily hydrolase (TIGR01509 family)